jgi:hypothetical protein
MHIPAYLPAGAGVEPVGRPGPGPVPGFGLSPHAWPRRQFSSDGAENKKIQIGIALGVILGAFLIGACAFLYIYRGSVRCAPRKRRRGHHHHHSGSSRSSRSSKHFDGGAAPPPPPPPPEA